MAGARVERIDVAAVVAEEDTPVRVRNRCVDLVPRLEAPQQARVRPAPYVQRIHVVVPGAEVENAVDEQGGRLDSAGPVAPEDLAAVEQNAALRPEEDRDDEPRLRARIAVARIRLHVRLIDDVLADRGRRGAAVQEMLAPPALPRCGVDREAPPAALVHEPRAVPDDRGELDDVSRPKRPDLLERRPEMKLDR